MEADPGEIERRMGYIRARLELLSVDEGGLVDGIVDDQFAYFELRRDIKSGANLMIEDADHLAAGDVGTVRLYPSGPKALWQRMLPLNRPIHMLDASRQQTVGLATILDRVPGAIWWEP